MFWEKINLSSNKERQNNGGVKKVKNIAINYSKWFAFTKTIYSVAYGIL